MGWNLFRIHFGEIFGEEEEDSVERMIKPMGWVVAPPPPLRVVGLPLTALFCVVCELEESLVGMTLYIYI